MGNSNRRRTEEDMQLNPSSQNRETENNHLNPQYIRVADDTDVEILWKLLIEEWKIPKPKMIISLAGGVKHFVGWNEDRLKKLFNKGLVKAAIKTGAESRGEENAVIPVVLVVVEGGYGTIEIVHKALVRTNANSEGHSIPVVIVGGSGRAADIIVKALRLMDNNELNDETCIEDLKKLHQNILGDPERISMDDCVTWLKEISNARKSKLSLITVFQMEDANLKDIDSAILNAVLPTLPYETQLDLAFALNRCDIAKDEILKPDKLFYWQV
ncbi:transient receptor potential cation channel subfamily M member 1-like [Ptychodera flava]|uniref:transient receptor potential cation channel subfamily M member 1-like n=1 Tax=Ptychodera flava TaxID=63121 RepID=UPI00396A7E81